MKFLLDTHALLWWFTDDERLPRSVRDVMIDDANTILVSAATAWEIAIKHQLGKLNQATDVVHRFSELIAADRFEHLPISYFHAIKAGAYQVSHRDPFDRMLAAQSEIESLPLITCDSVFALFGTRIFW